MLNGVQSLSWRTACVLAAWLCLAGKATQAESVRSRAVVHLSFDEKAGDAIDSALEGRQPNNGALRNGAERIISPFFGQAGRRALLLEADKKQFVEVPDSPDTDRAEAVSFGLFFLSLHDLEDAAARGVIAKRIENPASSNYGINYVAKSNNFQLYINDGGGFRVAQFSVKDTIGFRRMCYLTAVIEAGDAPAPDEDTDRDDVRMRLYFNGQPVKPTNYVGGAGRVEGNDAWATDVKLAGLLNDVPLTLGATNKDLEFTSCVIDEFSLFDKALSDAEVAALFTEVGGSHAAELAKRELQPASPLALPEVATISQRGFQKGTTTRVVVKGANFGEAGRITVPIKGVVLQPAEGSNAGQLVVDMTIPVDCRSGLYPLRVQTQDGVSNALTIAVDELPQLPVSLTSADKPAELPAAFFGTVSGAEQSRVYFQGHAGMRLVADVESRRLGSRMEPVVEVKHANGTPLAIEWGKVFLEGDTRAVLELPDDGLYFVEVHDLSYRAPGGSPLRVKVGSLKLVDAVFPAALTPGSLTEVTPVGTGLPGNKTVVADLRNVGTGIGERLPLPELFQRGSAAPVVRYSDCQEVIELPRSGFVPQTVDATFTSTPRRPVAINGRILEPGQFDLYLLQVTAGQELRIALEARSLNSPLDGQLAVLKHPEGTVLASSNDQPGTRDPALTYKVPEGVSQIQLGVRDLFGRGGDHFLYRTKIQPADLPAIELQITTAQASLPANGSAVLEMQVTRTGYQGPIQLKLEGDEHISVFPDRIPGGGNEKVFVTLTRQGGDADTGLREVRIIGESVDIDPPVRAVALLTSGSVPGFEDILPVAVTSPIGARVQLAEVPKQLLKGVDAELVINLERFEGLAGADQSIRFTLMTNEPERKVNPRAPQQGNKPRIRTEPHASLAAGQMSSKIKLIVPGDVAARAVSFVVRADLVPNPFSNQVLGTVYSKPIRLPVRNAVAVEIDPQSINLVSETESKVKGTIKRTAGFEGAVTVQIVGLPGEVKAEAVNVPAGADRFEIPVKAGIKANEVRPVPGNLRVAEAGGTTLLPDRPLGLKVAPAAATATAATAPATEPAAAKP